MQRRRDRGPQSLVPRLGAAAAQQGCAGLRVLFVLICPLLLAAPLWADHVAHTGPNKNHTTDKIVVDGQQTDVVCPDGTPLGPGSRGRRQVLPRRRPDRPRRDGAADVRRPHLDLHRHRSALITTAPRGRHRAAVRLLPRLDRRGDVSDHGRDLGLSGPAARHRAGHRAGSRRSQLGPIEVAGDSLWIPILIIGFVYMPYMAVRSAVRYWRCARRSSWRPLWPGRGAGADHVLRAAA